MIRAENLEDKRRTKKTNIMLLSISMVFCIAWLPLNLISIILDAGFNLFGDNTEMTLLSFIACHLVSNSVGSESKLGSARFWLELLGKKARISSSPHILQKSSVQLGLLYDFKNRVTLKTKNELIFNIFATFLRYNLEDINKSVFFLLKSCIL